ncbi:MAG TPA: DUF3048 domain-containing protein [Actinophytocola sp.]|jgi:hypothetical protein|nr:DUF3048 domain-containing protein [Actinophytocola sp.]
MRRGARLAWGIGAVVVVIAVVAAVLVLVNRDDGAPATPAAPAPGDGPVVAVKVDNVADARPQTGLGAAAVVYVEPVEGGLTRLVAIYAGKPPAVVGPVRSARRTDIELLAQWGTPVLAYSGAAPQLLPALHSAQLVNASPVEAGGAYHRGPDRPAPHNLYVNPGDLPGGAKAPAQAPLQFGAAPAGGTPTTRQDVTFTAARYTFTWSAGQRRWLVAMDGTPLVSTDSGRVTAATVVVQRVGLSTSEPIEDAHGNVSPVAVTVGAGAAQVLRDGKEFTGTWTRLGPASPTRFRTTSGSDLPLADGPVWVLLTPTQS